MSKMKNLAIDEEQYSIEEDACSMAYLDIQQDTEEFIEFDDTITKNIENELFI